MVFTQANITSFFEDNDQMGVPHDTYVQLQAEGIENVSDLADFDKDSLHQLADNLRRPGGRIPDPNPGAAAGATIPTPFLFSEPSRRSAFLLHVILFDTTTQSAANLLLAT